MNQGAVHEAMALAAAKQLPVIFAVENNGWSELTATGDMSRVDRLAQRAQAYGFPGATISGVDPIAVRDSFALAAHRCRKGEGPVLIECRVPRLWGHYNRDVEHYRPKEDREKAEAQDPLVVFGRRLIASGFLSDEEVTFEIQRQRGLVEAMTETVLAAPLPEPTDAASHVTVSNASEPGSRRPASTETMTYVAAVNTALREALEDDPATVVYGEDVGKAGGIFGASRNLQRDFGAARVFDTPIAENAILGSAIGAALGGLKPIVEIMWADFVFVAIDQLINQAANVRYVTQGRSSAPIVVRMQQGATPGSCPQHSQSIEAMLAHIPGLKLALAATPQDAYSLLRSAAADPDPCVIIEARSLYQTRGEVTLGGTPEPVGQGATLPGRQRCADHHLGRDGQQGDGSGGAPGPGHLSGSARSAMAVAARRGCDRSGGREFRRAGARRPRGGKDRRFRRRDSGAHPRKLRQIIARVGSTACHAGRPYPGIARPAGGAHSRRRGYRSGYSLDAGVIAGAQLAR